MLRRWFVGLVSIVSMAAMTVVGALPAGAATMIDWERVAGPTGVQTSLAMAKNAWGTDWPVVYVASNRNPVDALPAATIGDGPVILSNLDRLDLGGVKPGKIIVLGGVGALPATIEDQAVAAVGRENVERIWGMNRYETAREVAKRWVEVNGKPKVMYITKNVGTGSPDAVAGSVLRDGPILMFGNNADTWEIVYACADKLQVGDTIIALGGPATVPQQVLDRAAQGKKQLRLGGANRFETSYLIAQRAKAQGGGSVVYITDGNALKDAMVAGAAKHGIILLCPRDAAGVNNQLTELGADKVIAVGGNGVLFDNTVKLAVGEPLPTNAIRSFDFDNAIWTLGSPGEVSECRNNCSYQYPMRNGEYYLNSQDRGVAQSNLHDLYVGSDFGSPYLHTSRTQYGASLPAGQPTLGENIYGDINGDGFEDAIVYLHVNHDQVAFAGPIISYESYIVWLWDPIYGTARSLGKPLVSLGRCAESVSSIDIIDGGVSVVYLGMGDPMSPNFGGCMGARFDPISKTYAYNPSTRTMMDVTS